MLKNVRNKIGLSQIKLARKLKVTQSYISKLENNKIDNVSTNLILELSNELNLCPILVFVFFVDCCQECHLNCHFKIKK